MNRKHHLVTIVDSSATELSDYVRNLTYRPAYLYRGKNNKLTYAIHISDEDLTVIKLKFAIEVIE